MIYIGVTKRAPLVNRTIWDGTHLIVTEFVPPEEIEGLDEPVEHEENNFEILITKARRTARTCAA